MEVRRIQTNDFGVATGRFRKQVFVRRNDVRDAHVVVVRVPAWAKNVAVEIDGVLVVGRDGKHTDAIAILHLKGFELRSQIARLTSRRNFDGKHGLLFVRDQALNLDMAKRGSGQQASGKFQHVGEIVFVTQLVNRRAADHAFHCDLWPDGRNENRVAVVEAAEVGVYAAEQQIVQVYNLDELSISIVFHETQRTFLRRAAGREQCVQ